MTAPTARRPRIRLVELQVVELEAEPQIGHWGNLHGVALPPHFTRAVEHLYDATVRWHGTEVCGCCHKAHVGWTYTGGVHAEADYRWHPTVMVTTDGGATIKTMCEDCAGDIGPEVIFV